MADPKFVRLAEHLTRGGRYDINSGFGISGYDVVPMPNKDEQPNAYKYVKGELQAGRLEGASKAEYEEAHPDIAGHLGYKTPEAVDQGRPYQEREVQSVVRTVHSKVKARRQGESEVDAFEADQKRREATLAAQKAQEGRTTSTGRQKAAAEAEDEANEATQEHLRREAEVRQRGGAPVVPGANLVEEDDDEDDESESDAYEEMGKEALKDEAERRGLAKSGSADTLRERLRAHDAEQESDDDSDDDDSSDDDGDEDDDQS